MRALNRSVVRSVRRPVRMGGPLLAACALALGGCVSGGPPEPPAPIEAPGLGVEIVDLSESEVTPFLFPPPASPAELADPILASPVAADPDVRRRVNYWILRWQTWGEDSFARYLERMGYYSELVDLEIEERGLPTSLRYLPVVESGYNPRAFSPVGAAGMWQFMSPTARFLGMDVTPLLDERRDPWLATGYALDYLIELNERFEGSWFLALAAYNGGWGRVQRIIDREGNGAAPSDSLFWALRDHFPAETRDFVPKLLAAARLARSPETYGFEPRLDIQPLLTDEVRVPDATSLDVVARAAGVSLDEVERLNTHVVRGYTPPGRETVLRVPRGSGERFAAAYSSIPSAERVSFIEHRIRPGETLSHVADRYLVPVSELRAANPRISPRRLQIGQWVIVPRAPTGSRSGDGVRLAASGSTTASGPEASSADASTITAPDGGVAGASSASVADGSGSEGADGSEGFEYRVTRGESLWSIARRYGVRVADLRRWNGLDADHVLHAGESLTIRGVQAAVYRVRAGDTLSDIALRHGVRTDVLMRANGLSSPMIRPGDEVHIPQ